VTDWPAAEKISSDHEPCGISDHPSAAYRVRISLATAGGGGSTIRAHKPEHRFHQGSKVKPLLFLRSVILLIAVSFQHPYTGFRVSGFALALHATLPIAVQKLSKIGGTTNHALRIVYDCPRDYTVVYRATYMNGWWDRQTTIWSGEHWRYSPL
jgi:hypothetical protein